MKSGFAHIGLSTHDMGNTIDFYCGLLECQLLADERIELGNGGVIRQVSIGVGAGQYIVFMEAKGVPSIREDYDTGINGALGVPAGMYHFALKVDSEDELVALADSLTQKNVEVSEVTDLGIAKSVFLQDPNGLQVEISVMIREFAESDIGRVTRAEVAES